MADATQPEPSAGALPPGVESRPGLLRVLGPGMAMAMVVGNVIGSGIFLKPGIIAAKGGEFGLILTAWFVGGGLCILGGLCFAELACMMPRAGGMYVYLRETYGRPVAFLFGWADFLFRSPASIGALAVAFVGALGTACGVTFGLTTGMILSLLLIAGMAWVNVIGVIWGGRVQAGTTIIKAGFLGVIALLPFLVMLGGFHEFDVANYSTTIDLLGQRETLADAAFGLTGGPAVAAEPGFASLAFPARFAAVMLAVMWAYNGWHGITPVAEEICEPRRNIPLALFGGIGILIVLYIGANLAYHGVLTIEEMSQSGENTAQQMVGKLFSSGSRQLAAAGVAAISAVIMCSTFGAINSNLLNAPRITFAMGRDDVFFRQLGQVHVNYRTPAVAIVVQAMMSAGLVVASGVLVAAVDGFQQTSIFEMLTNFVIFSASIFYMLSVLAVILLRRRHPEWERPYRTWGYPVVPVAYLAFYGWFLWQVFWGQPFEAVSGLGLIALGLPVYFAWRKWAARHPQNLTDGA